MNLYNENVQINAKTREDKLSTVKIEKKRVYDYGKWCLCEKWASLKEFNTLE